MRHSAAAFGHTPLRPGHCRHWRKLSAEPFNIKFRKNEQMKIKNSEAWNFDKHQRETKVFKSFFSKRVS